MAGGGVRGPVGSASGETQLRGLFPDHQGRSDRRHGEIRELHSGGWREVPKEQSFHSECQIVCDRLVWD